MSLVAVNEADFPKLVSALVSGAESEVIISSDGEEVVRMVAIPRRKPIRLGLEDGKFKLNIKEFDRMDAEIERLFEDGADPLGDKLPR